jgi:hypothetical protein
METISTARKQTHGPSPRQLASMPREEISHVEEISQRGRLAFIEGEGISSVGALPPVGVSAIEQRQRHAG